MKSLDQLGEKKKTILPQQNKKLDKTTMKQKIKTKPDQTHQSTL
mgnify:CR=1 FL=1